jgi:hypothetical protein
LAFVPTEDVVNLFDQLSGEDWDEMEVVRIYFESTYIGTWKMTKPKPIRGQPTPQPILTRTRPDFPVEHWNLFERTLEGRDRTNNRVEAWNSAISKSFKKPHPTMWELLRQIQVEANLTCSRIQHVSAGTYQRKTNKKYIRLDKTLRTICNRYNTFENKLDYLEKIAHVLGSY